MLEVKFEFMQVVMTKLTKHTYDSLRGIGRVEIPDVIANVRIACESARTFGADEGLDSCVRNGVQHNSFAGWELGIADQAMEPSLYFGGHRRVKHSATDLTGRCCD